MHLTNHFLWTVGAAHQQPELTDLGRSMTAKFVPWSVIIMVSPTLHTRLGHSK
jgi:hypothetical protein